MSFDNPVVACLVGAIGLLLLFLVVRLYILTKHVSSSFAKLGFIVREDAKKYFDDASEKIVTTNKQFQEMYQGVVEEGTKRALTDTTQVIERAVVDAQQQAGKIVLNAQVDAQQIINEAKVQAAAQMNQTLERTADTVAWVLEQYMKESYSVKQHEVLIEKLVKMYVDEHRK
jgi:hypothetical protein